MTKKMIAAAGVGAALVVASMATTTLMAIRAGNLAEEALRQVRKPAKVVTRTVTRTVVVTPPAIEQVKCEQPAPRVEVKRLTPAAEFEGRILQTFPTRDGGVILTVVEPDGRIGMYSAK